MPAYAPRERFGFYDGADANIDLLKFLKADLLRHFLLQDIGARTGMIM